MQAVITSTDRPLALVVDDSESALGLRRELLQGSGFITVGARSPGEALLAINQNPEFDAAVVDLKLSSAEDDMSGTDVAAMLRLVNESMIIVGYSSYVTFDMLSETHRSLFDFVYGKGVLQPAQMLDLSERLHGMALKQRARRLGSVSDDIETAFLVAYLQEMFGQKMAAFILGVGVPSLVGCWARGEAEPDAEVRGRIEIAFEISRMIRQVESVSTLQAWFLGKNSGLGDRAPAIVLALDPDSVREAASDFILLG